MPLYKKLLLIFMSATFLLVVIGLGFNLWMVERADRQEREQLRDQLRMSVDRMQHQLDTLNDSLFSVAVSSDVNLMSLYDLENNIGEITTSSKSLYARIAALQSSFPITDGLWVQFTTLNRQVSEDVRWDMLDKDLFALFSEATDKALAYKDNIYMAYPLPVARISYNNSLVGVRIPVQSLMDELISGCSQSISAQLMLYDEVIAAHGDVEHIDASAGETWQKGDGGWSLSLPINLISHDSTIKLQVLIPRMYMTLSQRSFAIWAIIYAVMVVIELLMFFTILQRLVHRPLTRLIEAFDRLVLGDLHVRVNVDKQDEFAALYNHFNSTVERLDDTIKRKSQAELSRQRAELKQLQQQIQPHFLYNSFYHLYRTCQMEGCSESAAFSLQLARYYEYITHETDPGGMVPLASEYAHTAQYLSIYSFRYCDRLNVNQHPLDPQWENLRVPKLILQPIVENAIKHCLEKRSDAPTLTIDICAYMENNSLKIVVEDDSRMMTEEAVEALRAQLDDAKPSGDNSGLANTHLRLKLFSPQSGLTLQRNEKGGLRVVLSIEIL